MQLSVLLLAASFASSAIATSYNYARGIDIASSHSFPEFEERALDADNYQIRQFLRSLDEDELDALYRRTFRQTLTRLKQSAQHKANTLKSHWSNTVGSRIGKMKHDLERHRLKKGAKEPGKKRIPENKGNKRFKLD